MPIDWECDAKLIERQDGGSELYYDFTTLKSGPLSALVAEVMAMDANDRARLLIDAGGTGTFNVAQIVALARDPDFPES